MRLPARADAHTSIVLLTCNRRDEALRTLAQLRTNLPDTPIIVVDNGSRDGTAQAIRHHHPDVALVPAHRNLGAAGRNLGVERVTTRYVAFCDDDTCWEAGSLARAAAILDAAPDIAVVTAQIRVGATGRLDPTCAVMADSPLGRTAHGPLLLGFMAGACVMRTAAFHQAGGYWPRYFIGGEEALLALDLVSAGWQIVYAKHVITRHLPSSVRNAGRRRNLLARNAIWTAWLRLPPGQAWQITRDTLAAVAGWRRRLWVGLQVLAGSVAVLRHRRVIPPHVQRMREHLLDHPHPPHTRITESGTNRYDKC